MSPRAVIRNLLGSDSELQGYDFTEERIFATASVDSPDREHRWMVIKWGDRQARFGTVGAMLMEAWLYQPEEMGIDYGVIDVGLERVKELLVIAEQIPGADGWTLNGAEWESDSPDLRDEGFRALTRFSRFRVSGRSVINQ